MLSYLTEYLLLFYTKTVPLLIQVCLIMMIIGRDNPAAATQGHIFAKGIVFNAATYVHHPEYGTHPSYYGNPPEQVVDINIGSLSADDEGTPLYAPEDGTVTFIHYNTDSWGYSVEWENSEGSERLFLAHLNSVLLTGAVKAGEKIGELGGTGGWNPHLHIESAAGWVELSGREIQPPINPGGNGMLYISNGPVTGDEPRVKIPPPSLLTLSVSVSGTEDSNFSIMPQLEDSLIIAPDPTVAIPSPKENATDEAVDD